MSSSASFSTSADDVQVAFTDKSAGADMTHSKVYPCVSWVIRGTCHHRNCAFKHCEMQKGLLQGAKPFLLRKEIDHLERDNRLADIIIAALKAHHRKHNGTFIQAALWGNAPLRRQAWRV